MKYAFPFFVLCLFFSCKKNQEGLTIIKEEEKLMMEDNDRIIQLEEDKKSICSSTGVFPKMPILNEQNQLKRIERIRKIEDKTLINIDSFIYDANDALLYIKERIINIKDERINTDIFEFEFKEDLLISINQSDQYLPLRRDSLVYDANGNLLRIFNFTLQREPFISLSNPYALFSIDSFFYDNKGYLNYRNTYLINQAQHFSHNIYCWEDGNLTNVKNYNAEGELINEQITTYSQEKEFKVFQLDPRFWDIPEIWSTNKVIDSQFFDYVGNIDFVCNPCNTKYDYDEFGRIIKIENEYSTTNYIYRK